MFLYHKTLIPAEVNGAWVAARQNGSISGQGANLWPADFFGENTTFFLFLKSPSMATALKQPKISIEIFPMYWKAIYNCTMG